MKNVLKKHYNTKNRPIKIWRPLNLLHERNFALKIILDPKLLVAIDPSKDHRQGDPDRRSRMSH